MKFTHLNPKQRYQIEWRLSQGHSKSSIAYALGVHPSTVYREWHRGQQAGRYSARRAQAGANQRQARSAANHPTKPAALWRQVRRQLRQDWSPDEIGGRLRCLDATVSVSAQAIYNWLRTRQNPETLAIHLRYYRRASPWGVRHGGMPKGRPRIGDRPTSVLARQEPGHWEGDTIRGASPHHCLLTLVERKSLYTQISSPLKKQAVCVARAVRTGLYGLPALSLTLDNGTEFAAYAEMGLPVFFADPGKPRQRARNENTNGLIRQYVPKYARINALSEQRIREIEPVVSG